MAAGPIAERNQGEIKLILFKSDTLSSVYTDNWVYPAKQGE